ncbi:RNA polymerase II-associated protein 3-like [Helicoverpa zea]|uniref:RNA polymerase II-associated protein 3-like n=1 Tax=Helicoverpa zea TaxID=7113 RepID=UPI001F58B31C|nr:RNA polymerase II-associated protein 3-like [Helicoverpa zea]
MSILNNPAFKDRKPIELDEEFNNFMKRVGEVSSLVRDMASGDKVKADAAKVLADQYLGGKVILDDDLQLKVKQNRTLINEKAFENLGKQDASEMDKEAWMAEVSKDAEMRYQDRKIRREKADTLKTQAVKAFRRQEYDRALSCYNRAIEQVRDDPMLYCDRALTKIKLGKFDKVFSDCDMALRLNENSLKARLYQAKAYKEMEEMEKLQECRKELDEMFPQHQELIQDFLDKKVDYEEEAE